MINSPQRAGLSEKAHTPLPASASCLHTWTTARPGVFRLWTPHSAFHPESARPPALPVLALPYRRLPEATPHHGQHQALIVVRVLPNEVDAARR